MFNHPQIFDIDSYFIGLQFSACLDKAVGRLESHTREAKSHHLVRHSAVCLQAAAEAKRESHVRSLSHVDDCALHLLCFQLAPTSLSRMENTHIEGDTPHFVRKHFPRSAFPTFDQPLKRRSNKLRPSITQLRLHLFRTSSPLNYILKDWHV